LFYFQLPRLHSQSPIAADRTRFGLIATELNRRCDEPQSNRCRVEARAGRRSHRRSRREKSSSCRTFRLLLSDDAVETMRPQPGGELDETLRQGVKGIGWPIDPGITFAALVQRWRRDDIGAFAVNLQTIEPSGLDDDAVGQCEVIVRAAIDTARGNHVAFD